MFSENKKKQSILPSLGKPNTISEASVITGDMVSESDIRVDGKIEGTIKTTGKLVIGKNGVVKGKVNCGSADFEGKFSGELLVNGLLNIKPSATVVGELIVGKLAVEPGASIEASFKMKGNLKAISNEQPKVAEKAV